VFKKWNATIFCVFSPLEAWQVALEKKGKKLEQVFTVNKTLGLWKPLSTKPPQPQALPYTY
jgi:hypothetical protein